MSKYDLITIGGATWDAIVTADETTVLEQAGNRFLAFPYAKKLYMEQAFFGYGGGAANVAVSTSRLGLKVSFVGAVGTTHTSISILDNFADEGVDTTYVKKDPAHRSAVSLVLTAPDGERTVLLYRGANNHLSDADINWDHCTKTKWLYVSSLSGESDALYNKVAETARTNSVCLAINPGATQVKRGTKGLHVALQDSAIILLNEAEARELLRQRGEAGETVPEMLHTLQHINHGIAIITQGEQGAQGIDQDNLYTVTAVGEGRVNTLGAGDAFGSTFTAAHIKGIAADKALRLASINAASVVSDYGAQTALLSWKELSRRAADEKDFVVKVTPHKG